MRSKIIASAAQMIVENGLSCSISAIAKHAGVAVGSIYTYFPSKKEMSHAVYQEIAEDMYNFCQKQGEPLLDYKEKFYKVFEIMLEYLLLKPQNVMLLDYLSVSPYINFEQKKEIFEKNCNILIPLIEEGQNAGILVNSLEVDTMISLLIGVVMSYARLMIKTGQVASGKQKQVIIDCCWNMVRV